MICANCVISIGKNNQYLHCLKCNALYCTKCINSNQFVLDEETLLYIYNCKMCLKKKLL
jgi:hypothetical protein